MRMSALSDQVNKLMNNWGDRQVVIQVGDEYFRLKGIEVLVRDPRESAVILVVVPDMNDKIGDVEEEADVDECCHPGKNCSEADCDCPCICKTRGELT